MNVYFHEMKVSLRSALLWSASLALIGLAVFWMFPTFSRDVEPLMRLMKNYPEAALRALGIDPSTLNTFNGLYSFMFVFILLSAAIQGLIYGIGVISKEGARKTSDFLFSRPMSRVRILTAKYAAMLTLLVLTSAAYVTITYLAARAYVQDLDMRGFWLFSGAFFLTQWFCLSIGFCIGCFARKIKAPNAVGIGLGALFFALLMVENFSDERSIGFLSPLCYVNPHYIVTHRAYHMGYIWALMLLSVGLMIAGVVRYKARDIHSA